MDSKRKEEIEAFYNRLFNLLYKKKVDRKVVKRLLYEDEEHHKKLDLTEGMLNTMWDRLCKGKKNTHYVNTPIIIQNKQFEVISVNKEEKPKQANKGGGKVATQVIQYNPETNKEVRRFKSAVACAEELGLKIGTVRNILYGITNNPKAHIRYAEPSEQKVEISEQKPKRKYTKKSEPVENKEENTITVNLEISEGPQSVAEQVIQKVFGPIGNAELKKIIDDVTNPAPVVAKPDEELVDGYEELNETPLEKQDEPNSFETAPDPEPVPQAMAESHAWFKTPVGLRFEPSEQKIVINADVEIQHTPGDKTTLEVIRTAYIKELKNHINDEVKKLTSEIIAEETKRFIEGTKTI